MDLAAASHIFGHHPRTLAHWLARARQHSQRLQERLFHRALTIGHLQLDELVTKVKQESGYLWLWTAVAAESKLILAVHLGGRTTADAH